MKKLSVLLVCGGGTSSGFMAANLRKAAKAAGVELDAKARSESEIELYVDEADGIMLGPHLSYLEDEIKERVGDAAKVFVMDRTYYATLDGQAALDDLLDHLK